MSEHAKAPILEQETTEDKQTEERSPSRTSSEMELTRIFEDGFNMDEIQPEPFRSYTPFNAFRPIVVLVPNVFDCPKRDFCRPRIDVDAEKRPLPQKLQEQQSKPEESTVKNEQRVTKDYKMLVSNSSGYNHMASCNSIEISDSDECESDSLHVPKRKSIF